MQNKQKLSHQYNSTWESKGLLPKSLVLEAGTLPLGHRGGHQPQKPLTQSRAMVKSLDHCHLQGFASVAGEQSVELVLGDAQLAVLDWTEVLPDVLKHPPRQLPLSVCMCMYVQE